MKKLLILSVGVLMFSSCDYAAQRIEQEVTYRIDSVVDTHIGKAVGKVDSTMNAKADSAIKSF